MSKLTVPSQMKTQAIEVSKILKVMAHPERLLLLCQLSLKSLSVTELESHLNMGQSQISQTLQKLEQMDLVTFKRQGKLKYYQLSNPKIKKLIETLYQLYCKES